MNPFDDETLDERLQRLEAEFKSRPDPQYRQLLHDLQYGKREITPQDLENAKAPPPLSDENEFAFGQNERDKIELQKIYGAEWPSLYREVLDYCGRQTEEWQDQKFCEIERDGRSIKTFQKIVSEMRRQGR